MARLVATHVQTATATSTGTASVAVGFLDAMTGIASSEPNLPARIVITPLPAARIRITNLPAARIRITEI